MLGSHEEVPPGVWRIESWQLCSREKSCPQWLARVRATIRLMVRSLVRASEPGEHGNRTIEQLPDGCCTWAPKVQGRGWGRVHGRRVGTGWQENDKCPNVGAWLVADKPVRQREERERMHSDAWSHLGAVHESSQCTGCWLTAQFITAANLTGKHTQAE